MRAPGERLSRVWAPSKAVFIACFFPARLFVYWCNDLAEGILGGLFPPPAPGVHLLMALLRLFHSLVFTAEPGHLGCPG